MFCLRMDFLEGFSFQFMCKTYKTYGRYTSKVVKKKQKTEKVTINKNISN
jgi:hypothetical protein